MQNNEKKKININNRHSFKKRGGDGRRGGDDDDDESLSVVGSITHFSIRIDKILKYAAIEAPCVRQCARCSARARAFNSPLLTRGDHDDDDESANELAAVDDRPCRGSDRRRAADAARADGRQVREIGRHLQRKYAARARLITPARCGVSSSTSSVGIGFRFVIKIRVVCDMTSHIIARSIVRVDACARPPVVSTYFFHLF